jgi:hypothetical protein
MVGVEAAELTMDRNAAGRQQARFTTALGGT